MADQTSIQETAQALFCAIADIVGKTQGKKLLNEKEYDTFEKFKMAWNYSEYGKRYPLSKLMKEQTEAPAVTLKQIESLFKKDNDWYISSIKIAKKLIEDISDISRKFTKIQQPEWSSIFYVRGDPDVMKRISVLFKAAQDHQKEINKTGIKGQVFGDINKWSPADIYFASPKAKDVLKDMEKQVKAKHVLTFDELNSTVTSLINSGDMLPLSLKKQTREVHIVKVNFDRKAEKESAKEYVYGGMRPERWVPYVDGSKKDEYRDVIIYANKEKTLYIKIRHVADSSGALKTEFIDKKHPDARGGSIGSASVLSDVVSIVDRKLGSDIVKAYDAAQKSYSEFVKSLKTKYPKAKKEELGEMKAQFSGRYVANAVMPILVDWFARNKNKKADDLIQTLFLYITSRSDNSARFVIAK